MKSVKKDYFKKRGRFRDNRVVRIEINYNKKV